MINSIYFESLKPIIVRDGSLTVAWPPGAEVSGLTSGIFEISKFPDADKFWSSIATVIFLLLPFLRKA